MLITRTSRITGIVHTLELPVTQDQLNLWTRGEGLIQDIFPNLTPGQREFILSGITEEEWDAVFKDD